MDKSILQEGNPGVGKTAIIDNIAYKSGNKLFKITLSEHTDIIDLLGSDLPSEDHDKISFKWHDGILLQVLLLS